VAELRELFEKLQLTIAYQPEDQALEVEITLYQDARNESEGQSRSCGGLDGAPGSV
jgi:hypothetical protein